MKAATDNAEELKTKLTRIMNRARQDSITTEIMEIVGGAEALKNDKGGPEDLLLEHLVPSDAFAEHLDSLDDDLTRLTPPAAHTHAEPRLHQENPR